MRSVAGRSGTSCRWTRLFDQGYEKGFSSEVNLFDNVTPDMQIYKEEIFGPVLSVVRSPDFDMALQIINDHEFGSGVSIFTRDVDASANSNRIEVGMVGVNVPALRCNGLSFFWWLEGLGLR